MYRSLAQDKKRLLQNWMELVVIECVPFLYYLQYLVSRRKGDHSMMKITMVNLMKYVSQDLGKSLQERSSGHVDTSLHVFAHCWELENRPDIAWHFYQQSINMFPTNSIAFFHLMRLFGLHFF